MYYYLIKNVKFAITLTTKLIKYILQFIIFFTFVQISSSDSLDSLSFNEKFNFIKKEFNNNIFSNSNISSEYLMMLDSLTKDQINSTYRLEFYLLSWQFDFTYGNVDLAKKSLEKLIYTSEKYNDNTKAKILTYIANVYFDYKMYDIAEQYYRYVLDLKNLKLPNVDYIQCLNGISGLFRIKGELDSAKFYITKALNYAEEIDDPKIYANSIQFYFNIFFSKYQLDSIEVNLNKMHVQEFKNNNYYQSSYYTILAYYSFLKRDLNKAIEYTRKVVEARKSIINPLNYFSSINNLGQMFMENGQYDSAYYYLKIAKDSLESSKNSHLINLNIEHLEKLYKITNDTSK